MERKQIISKSGEPGVRFELPSHLIGWPVKNKEKEQKLSEDPSQDLTRLSPNRLPQAGWESIDEVNIDKSMNDGCIKEQ